MGSWSWDARRAGTVAGNFGLLVKPEIVVYNRSSIFCQSPATTAAGLARAVSLWVLAPALESVSVGGGGYAPFWQCLTIRWRRSRSLRWAMFGGLILAGAVQGALVCHALGNLSGYPLLRKDCS